MTELAGQVPVSCWHLVEGSDQMPGWISPSLGSLPPYRAGVVTARPVQKRAVWTDRRPCRRSRSQDNSHVQDQGLAACYSGSTGSGWGSDGACEFGSQSWVRMSSICARSSSRALRGAAACTCACSCASTSSR